VPDWGLNWFTGDGDEENVLDDEDPAASEMAACSSGAGAASQEQDTDGQHAQDTISLHHIRILDSVAASTSDQKASRLVQDTYSAYPAHR